MSYRSHPPLFDHLNNVWRSVQIMKLLIMKSCSASCHFFYFRFKYSHQLPVLKHPQSMRVLRLLRRWCFKSRFSGLWRRVVL